MRLAKDALIAGRKWLRNRGVNVTRVAEPTRSFSGITIDWGRNQGTVRGTVVRVRHDTLSARFLVVDPRDEIQREHFHGQFYEKCVLDRLSDLAGHGTYVDVGANVGNHLVFMGKSHPNRRLVGFEPNPRAFELLEINIALNELSKTTRLLPFALGETDSRATMATSEHNLGAARIDNGSTIDIQVKVGDDLLAGEDIDIIKIDTEGFEMFVLSGLRKTIARCRPILFVEVDACNAAEFEALMRTHRYVEDESLVGKVASPNHLMIPEGR